MTDYLKNTEKYRCVNCGEEFIRRKKKRVNYGARVSNYFIKRIRKKGSVTCSSKCSVSYDHKRRPKNKSKEKKERKVKYDKKLLFKIYQMRKNNISFIDIRKTFDLTNREARIMYNLACYYKKKVGLK